MNTETVSDPVDTRYRATQELVQRQSKSADVRDLFGGHLRAKIPTFLDDASRFRPVPDNQEVFVSIEDHEDRSLVVEILEAAGNRDLVEALMFHTDALAHDNDATRFEIMETRRCTTDVNTVLEAGVAVSRQYLPSKGDAAPNILYVAMLLLRYHEKQSDIVVSVNIPGYQQNDSSVDFIRASVALLDEIRESFEIVDPNLFQ